MNVGCAVKRSNVEIRIEDFNLRVRLDAARGDFTFAGSINIDSFRTVAVNPQYDILEVKNNLGNIFFDAGNC